MPVQSRTHVPGGAEDALGELAAHAASLHAASGGNLLACFAAVPDPRDPRGIRHSLASILAMCAAAALCGCATLDDVTAWVSAADQQVLAAAGCRREAERREHARVEALAELTRLLAAALTPEAIGEVVADRVREVVGGADALCLGVISEDGRRLVWTTTAGYNGEVTGQFSDLALDVPSAAADAARTGLPVIIRTAAEYEERYPGPDTAACGSSWWRGRCGQARRLSA